MGEFEDLVDRAANGNAVAAETLKEKFGGSSLRQKAETGAEAQKRYDESLPYIRAGKFHDGLSRVAEDLRGMLTIDDVKDAKPEEITPEHLASLAQAKSESRKAALLTQAKDLGFETVEAMQATLDRVKQEQTAKKAALESISGAIASGAGSSPPPTGDFEKGKKAYDEARAKGTAQDYAMGKAVEAMIFEEGNA
jgi:hypothetical protein